LVIRLETDGDRGTARLVGELDAWTAENVLSPLELGLLVLNVITRELGGRVTEVDVRSAVDASFTVELSYD
jgi:hypothetical protein